MSLKYFAIKFHSHDLETEKNNGLVWEAFTFNITHITSIPGMYAQYMFSIHNCPTYAQAEHIIFPTSAAMSFAHSSKILPVAHGINT